MKRLLVPSLLLLSAASIHGKFSAPANAEVSGAGSTQVVDYMKALTKKYNGEVPCPKIVYKQSPTSLYAGSENGINRVLDASVTFAISDYPVPSSINTTSDTLLQIPFMLSSLSIIYRLPTTFTAGGNWPGHLNISPVDLCAIYTGSLGWNDLVSRLYNGATNTVPGNPVIKSFARSDSAYETALFVQYLNCSTTALTCSFAFNSAVVNNPNGPFCSGAPTWNLANVTCVNGSDAVANAVFGANGTGTNPNGAIGYVFTQVAIAHGFPIPTTGPTGGIPLGIAGLFVPGSTSYTSPQQSAQDNPQNYTQPTTAAVQAAAAASCTGDLLCNTGAYPIVNAELFVLYATQSSTLAACNIAQFITYALTIGQKIITPGFAPLTTACSTESLLLVDQIVAALCDTCTKICNPCDDQPCPLPCSGACKK